jgi:type III secretion control protein HpaP
VIPISPRPLRIVPGDLPGDDVLDDSGHPASGFDYASLLRGRAPARRLVTRTGAGAAAKDSGGRSSNESEADPQPTAQDSPAPAFPQPCEAGASAASQSIDRAALGARVANAAATVVSSVFIRQQRVLDVVGSLAREIAGFCSDPAIADAGDWSVQLPLAQHIFPHTTLYLTLSRFVLQLRFDAPAPETKQLLLDHSAMLERELDVMLRAWGEARDIELTVW